jgi:hypothetical protein
MIPWGIPDNKLQEEKKKSLKKIKRRGDSKMAARGRKQKASLLY